MLGARIPFRHDGTQLGAISAGIGVVSTADRDSNLTYAGANVGLELLVN